MYLRLAFPLLFIVMPISFFDEIIFIEKGEVNKIVGELSPFFCHYRATSIGLYSPDIAFNSF